MTSTPITPTTPRSLTFPVIKPKKLSTRGNPKFVEDFAKDRASFEKFMSRKSEREKSKKDSKGFQRQESM